jgi:hypothetical protein
MTEKDYKIFDCCPKVPRKAAVTSSDVAKKRQPGI